MDRNTSRHWNNIRQPDRTRVPQFSSWGQVGMAQIFLRRRSKAKPPRPERISARLAGSGTGVAGGVTGGVPSRSKVSAKVLSPAVLSLALVSPSILPKRDSEDRSGSVEMSV